MIDEGYGKVITHEQFSKSYPEDENINDYNVLHAGYHTNHFLDDDLLWQPDDILMETYDTVAAVERNIKKITR